MTMIDYKDALYELIGFIGTFLAVGAIGFRLFVLPKVPDQPFFDLATKRAALCGVVGLLILDIQYGLAARGQHSIIPFLQLLLTVLALAGLLFALGRIRAGWWVAAFGIVVGPLLPLATGKWTRVINPVHRLAAGFWIGTLFVMVIAGLSLMRRPEPVTEMVAAFSPLALGSFFVLALFGVITAWRHLKRLDALWTTPYGWALIVKLFFVLGVIGLGAWNWRRQRPLLGTDAASGSLKRSATAELMVAGVVLLVTAVLVSLPSPK